MKPIQTLKGIVIEGNKRGKALGYPTANMNISEALPEGVYASAVTVDNKTYKAATFIGASKTFDDFEYKLESFIFDFDKDIYDKEMSVDIFKHIRGNKKFDSQEALVQQMKKDVEAIQTFFGEN